MRAFKTEDVIQNPELYQLIKIVTPVMNTTITVAVTKENEEKLLELIGLHRGNFSDTLKRRKEQHDNLVVRNANEQAKRIRAGTLLPENEIGDIGKSI